MAAEEPAPPNLLRDLLVLTEIEQIPTILGTDAIAHHTIWGSSDINPRGKDLLAYSASAEADINEFQPFKASGPDGLYPVLLQKGWNQLKRYYHVIFQARLRHSNVSLAWKEGTGIILRHRTVQVELCGDEVKREVVKRNPQGGILSSFLWTCVLNSLLLELRSRGFYVQAYADDLAVLVTGADMLWIRGMAQKAINIAENCVLEQELQFNCKKTEIVLFTHKQNPDLGSLSMNGTKLELSKEARLLGVTLYGKLTWKPHITRITRKATTALMQCRQIVGKTWGITPSMSKWIYTAVICQPCRMHVCPGLAVSTKSI